MGDVITTVGGSESDALFWTVTLTCLACMPGGFGGGPSLEIGGLAGQGLALWTLALACLSVALSPLDLPTWVSWGVWGICAGIVAGVAALPFVAGRLKNGHRRAQPRRQPDGDLLTPRTAR